MTRSVQRNRSGFAKRLYDLRFDLGFTQQEVCEQTGVPVSTYRRWENGESTPTMGPYVRALAGFFRVRPGWLLRGDGDDR